MLSTLRSASAGADASVAEIRDLHGGFRYALHAHAKQHLPKEHLSKFTLLFCDIVSSFLQYCSEASSSLEQLRRGSRSLHRLLDNEPLPTASAEASLHLHNCLSTVKKLLIDLELSLRSSTCGHDEEFTLEGTTCKTLNDFVRIQLQYEICFAHCCLSRLFDVCGCTHGGETLFYCAMTMAVKLATDFVYYVALQDVLVRGLKRLRSIGAADSTFGRFLKRSLKDFLKQMDDLELLAYWNIWLELIEGCDAVRCGKFEVAAERADKACRLVQKMTKEKGGFSRKVVSAFGFRSNEPEHLQSPLQIVASNAHLQRTFAYRGLLIETLRAICSGKVSDHVDLKAAVESGLQRLFLVLQQEIAQVRLSDGKSNDIESTCADVEAVHHYIVQVSCAESHDALLNICMSFLDACGCDIHGTEADTVHSVAAESSYLPHCAYCCQTEVPPYILKYCTCKTVKYCGEACQKSHWRAQHKAECTLRSQSRMKCQ
eukprot:TRINITY_DN41397_c0_g1_i1.p1 TRINITY_DN41397_c0_g1~~TRINITY_DN41397_c0_g1_i1.p1  ORF type:complete len:486 (+),score=50.99 TRINITY_DN41397_c0_g1_i1:68-1525(+)